MNDGELDLLNIVLDSGYVVKGVLLVLILASIYSWAIILFKRASLSMIQKKNKAFLDIYNQDPALETIFKRSKNLPTSPFKTIFFMGHLELVRSHKVKVSQEKKMKWIERAIRQGANRANEEMGKWLPTLASIGSISPFVGLFGTVWGIIDSFSALASGGGTLEAVAPGIAEALVATAIGLLAAIPAVWFFNYFNALIGDINSNLDSFEQELLNTMEKNLGQGP